MEEVDGIALVLDASLDAFDVLVDVHVVKLGKGDVLILPGDALDLLKFLLVLVRIFQDLLVL